MSRPVAIDIASIINRPTTQSGQGGDVTGLGSVIFSLCRVVSLRFITRSIHFPFFFFSSTYSHMRRIHPTPRITIS